MKQNHRKQNRMENSKLGQILSKLKHIEYQALNCFFAQACPSFAQVLYDGDL